MWPRRQETFPRPDASPPRCAQLMGLAWRQVLSARAGRHSREEESSLPVRPWSAVDPYLRSTPFIQVKQQEYELGRAFNGQLADHHRFLFAPTLGRIASIDADIARHRRADRGASGPLSCGRRSWTPGSSSPKTWAQRRHPLVLARVECYTRRSAASRHPSRWRGAATRHPGGGCCASSRSLP